MIALMRSELIFSFFHFTLLLSTVGVYLIAALIELYSGAIVTMTGDDIRTWLLAIASGQKDWYTLLPLCLPHPLSSVDHSLSSPATSWSEFTCGWVHAATGNVHTHTLQDALFRFPLLPMNSTA